jgi:hypothetical protein
MISGRGLSNDQSVSFTHTTVSKIYSSQDSLTFWIERFGRLPNPCVVPKQASQQMQEAGLSEPNTPGYTLNECLGASARFLNFSCIKTSDSGLQSRSSGDESIKSLSTHMTRCTHPLV